MPKIPLKPLQTALLRWYRRHRRDLPWRLPKNAPGGTRLDPYHVLISEAMLQQTQVATVIPYFRRFIERFPDFPSLASADLQEVLRLWQGLGYYSRARNLWKCARAVVDEFGGQLPQTSEELMKLPGIGRYTAGAIASIAFEKPAPILDGNVMRVLCRLDAIQEDPRARETQQRLWQRAAELVPARHPGDFNSAMMELGATVCLPRNPRCLVCPIAEWCQARRLGIQDQIPLARKARETPLVLRDVYCLRHRGRYVIERRPETGRWAGMWQFLTRERGAGLDGLRIRQIGLVGKVKHALTHRRYEFDVYCGQIKEMQNKAEMRWVRLEDLGNYPLPRPHVKIAAMLREMPDCGSAVPEDG